MPFFYLQMPKRKTWDPVQMKAAVQAMRNKEMGSYKASRVFNVPQTTLERYARNEGTSDEVIKTKMGRNPILPQELEQELVTYCLEMEEKYFGLSRRDVRCMAYQLAKLNNLKNPFSKEKEQAGKKWLRNFMRRHKQLSVRTPQGVSYARAKGFTREAVSRFFDIYELIMEKIKQHNKHTKVVGLRSKKQIGGLPAAERGSLITIVTCMNPAGPFIPPLVIFPRKNMKQELMDGTPLGSIYACHPSGWIQSELFTDWFKHFLKHVEPTADNPAVLVLDGHFTHTRNIEVINLARSNHVYIVCLPPHSSHKMQPLDLSFMSPFKTYYAQEIEMWLRNHADRGVVTVYQIGQLFGNAYRKAATAEIAAKGFEKAGLFPCNRYKFGPHEFINTIVDQTVPNPPMEALQNDPIPDEDLGNHSIVSTSSTEDISKPVPSGLQRQKSCSGQNQLDSPATLATPRPQKFKEDISKPGPSGIQPQRSCCGQRQLESPKIPATPKQQKFVIPSEISPVPVLNPGKQSARSGSAEHITGTPYKTYLEESQNKKTKQNPKLKKKENCSSCKTK